MIRFVYIGSQIEERGHQFAFFDTVTDRFLSFNGEEVFDSQDDFLRNSKDSYYRDRCLVLLDNSFRAHFEEHF